MAKKPAKKKAPARQPTGEEIDRRLELARTRRAARDQKELRRETRAFRSAYHAWRIELRNLWQDLSEEFAEPVPVPEDRTGTEG